MEANEKKNWRGILVYVQMQRDGVHPVGRELLGEASRLAEHTGEKIYAVAIGPDPELCRQGLMDTPAQECYFYQTEEKFQPVVYEKGLMDAIDTLHPAVVLVGGTSQGRSLASRLSVHYRTGVTADCTSLAMTEEGDLLQTRPAFGGNIMASILTPHSRPQFATVRPQVMQEVHKIKLNELKVFVKNLYTNGEKFVILDSKLLLQKDDLSKQDILVAAGRGVKKKEDLEMLRQLADLLGGKLVSSRALVEKGWMPPSLQLGLSGNTVRPKCIITCGISGSVQFMAGMQSSQHIIAINNDPNARIFEFAHTPICGDLYDIVPALIEKLSGQKEK
jgi:electron transfer flavoprotein alpha subunit